MDFSKVPDALTDPVALIVEALQASAPELSSELVMLVGAWSRDVFQAVLGHEFETRSTHDVDLAPALSGWETYNQLAGSFPRVGNTGIRFRVGGHLVDLVPFGVLESPTGTVAPPTRGETMSVWAFTEIYHDSAPLALSPTLSIRIPTVAGYTAAKMGAWLDRSAWRETRDANDLALVSRWYSEWPRVSNALYDTDRGQ